FAPFMRLESSSITCLPSGLSSALSNANRTSSETLIFSISGGCAANGGGGGATATGGPAGGLTTPTASPGAAALSGVQSLVLQHIPYGEVQTCCCESDT